MLTRGTQNCAYPMEHDAPLIAYVSELCDILGTQELRHKDNSPIQIRDLLGPKWRSNQDATSGTRSATSISWRRFVGIRRRLGLTALLTKLQLSRGRKIQMRYFDEVVTVDPDTGGLCHEIAIHLPLPSTGVQDEALRRLKRRITQIRRTHMHRSWCIYTDANMDIDQLAKDLGGVAVGGASPGKQIVGFVHSKNMRAGRAMIDPAVVKQNWTDHPFVSFHGEAPALPKKR